MSDKLKKIGPRRAARVLENLELRKIVPQAVTVSLGRELAEFVAEVMAAEGLERPVDVVYAAIDAAMDRWRETHPKQETGDGR